MRTVKEDTACKMPIKLNYNSSQKFLVLRIEGQLSIDDVESTTFKIFESKEFPPDVNTLWDVRQLSFEDVDIAFLKRLIETRKKYTGQRGSPKIAILSNNALAAPIIKLYVILSKGSKEKTSVFKTFEEAELWLCQD